MAFPPTKCGACGAEPLNRQLAIVSDPFTDQTYGLCKNCLSPIYETMSKRFMEIMRKGTILEPPQ
jgi:hypothetical protein